MTLVNASLLLGGLGIAIPVVLHLLLRQQPRRMPFPAVRFLQERRESNQRRLRLRHWLLLALRCLLVVGAALALARPSVAAPALGNWLVAALSGCVTLFVAAIAGVAAYERHKRAWVIGFTAATIAMSLVTGTLVVQASGRGSSRLLGDQEAPVAAALVIDTSPRLLYRHENRSLLEVARETAEWLVRQLPEDSDLAIVETRPGTPAYTMDRAAASKALQRLDAAGTTRALPAALEEAIDWAKSSAKQRREIYVLTDLTRAAWPDGVDAARKKLAEADAADVQLYVIDIGVESPRNAALGDVRLSTQSLPPGGELEISADVTGWNLAGRRTVELSFDLPDPSRPVLRDGQPVWPAQTARGQQEIELTEGTSATVSLRVTGLEPGTRHGQLRLIGEDALAADDVRYFTVVVREATPVLVVAPEGAVTRYFVEAVAPSEFQQTGRAPFVCRDVPQSALAQQNLAEYAVVCLLDPSPLTPSDWTALATFVERGGGLGLFLGHNMQADAIARSPEALRVLGGRLVRRWRSPGGDLFLAPDNYDHPITREFRSLATSIPWDQFPVYRHWEMDALEADTRIVCRYGNGKPALLDRTLGQGRVVVMTTPLSDPARPAGREAWNELPTAPDAWPFVVLADQIVQYLDGSRQATNNYLCGQLAVLPQREAEDPERYELFLPSGATQDVAPRGGAVTMKFTDLPGHYRLKGFRNGPVLRGFSANLSAAATNLDRIDRKTLDELLGADRYQFSRTRDEIDRGIGATRVGREFYPYLLVAFAAVFALEHLMASRFYGAKSPSHSPRGSQQ